MEAGFWAQEISAGKESKLTIPQGLALKISNVALPVGVKQGASLAVKKEQKEFAVATLAPPNMSSVVDIVFHANEKVVLKAIGGTVHLIGVVLQTSGTGAPRSVPPSPKAAPAASPKVAPAASPKVAPVVEKAAAAPKAVVAASPKPDATKAKQTQMEQAKAALLASLDAGEGEGDFDLLEGDEMDEGDEGDEGDDFPLPGGPFADLDDEEETHSAKKQKKGDTAAQGKPVASAAKATAKGTPGKPAPTPAKPAPATKPAPTPAKPTPTPAKPVPTPVKPAATPVKPLTPGKNAPGQSPKGSHPGQSPKGQQHKPNTPAQQQKGGKHSPKQSPGQQGGKQKQGTPHTGKHKRN